MLKEFKGKIIHYVLEPLEEGENNRAVLVEHNVCASPTNFAKQSFTTNSCIIGISSLASSRLYIYKQAWQETN